MHRQVNDLAELFAQTPAFAHIRSSDGRGPMWWAHEHGRPYIVKLLKSYGVSEKLRDKNGMTPLDFFGILALRARERLRASRL